MIYLNEKIKELPTNCLFNKGMVGCGGTTLAIEGYKPYVVAVPYTSLVHNKVEQYPNNRYPYHIFGVGEGVSVEDIQKYIDDCKVPKIITTYDSLPKVVEALGDKVSEMNLLVDEYHILFSQYSFRKDAIMYVLGIYKLFASYTFMTATPTEEEFVLEELKELPIVVQEWSDSEKLEVTVELKKCRDVMASATKLIQRFLSGLESGNLYLFVNSITTIEKLIKASKLTPENCRVVYSIHNPKIISYRTSEGKIRIPNSTVNDPQKKINFLTSTVFEGCDIYDQEGKTVILSDPFHKNTLLDIATSVSQIAGRIRDSKYIGKILHLYKENKYRELSYEEYTAYIQEQTEKAEKFITFYNSIEDEDIKYQTAPDNNHYLLKIDGVVVFDKNLPKIDHFNYRSQNVYVTTVALGDEYVHSNATVEHGEDYETFINCNRLDCGKFTFKETVQEIFNAKEEEREELIREAEITYPFIRKACYLLGRQRMASLDYVQKDIKNELLKIEDSSNEKKIFTKLGYEIGHHYSNSTIKADLKKAYTALGYDKRAAKATDISKYYYVKPHRKRINGKEEEGYLILGPKY